MKATTRFLAFVFAAVMLLSLASCADNKGNNNEITTAPEATVDGEVTEELYLGYEKDRLPTNLNYNNETVKVLYWSDAERKEFEIKEDEDDSDLLEDEDSDEFGEDLGEEDDFIDDLDLL